MRRCLLFALSLFACGESSVDAPSPSAAWRAVRPLVSEDVAATPRPLLEQDGLDVSLAAGEAWELALPRLRAIGNYQVVLEYEGAQPLIAAGPDALGRFLPLRVVFAEAGRLEVTLRPTAAELTLRVRAGPEGARLHALRVRRWATAEVVPRRAARTADEQLRRLSIAGDHRPGWSLTDDFELPATLPEGATRLALAWAEPPGAVAAPGGTSAPVRAPRVSWRGDDGSRRVLVQAGAVVGPGRWRETAVSLEGLAGGAGRLAVETEGPLAFAVPEVLIEQGRRRPSLVLVSLDTTRADRLSVYGYERPTTPRLEALAAEHGVVCEELLSVSSYTLPSHATMFSGMHPLGHGVRHPAQALDTEAVPLLADLLRRQGYATRARTGGGYLSAEFGFSHGFASYGERDPARPSSAADRRWMDSSPEGALMAASLESQSWERALDWLEARRDVPVFLFLQSFAIHDYRPDPGDRARFGAPPEGQGVRPLRTLDEQLERPYDEVELAQLDDLYDAALASMDRRLGALIDRLQALGLWDDTVLVVTADHGESLAEHVHEEVPLVGHGFGLWDELVRVPLIIAAPGLAPRRVRERLSQVDLAPTLLELLDQPVPEAMQGRSLAELLAGRRPPRPPSAALLDLETPVSSIQGFYDGRTKLILGDPAARVRLPLPVPRLLFDLADDPTEQHDLASERPDRASELARLVEGLVQLLSEDGRGPLQAEVSEETRRALAELGYLQR